MLLNITTLGTRALLIAAANDRPIDTVFSIMPVTPAAGGVIINTASAPTKALDKNTASLNDPIAAEAPIDSISARRSSL
jgi:hypothetical protein